MRDKLKSRKLWVFLAAFAVSCIFLYTGKLTGMEWVEFARWALLVYAGGNVGEHFAERKASNLGYPT